MIVQERYGYIYFIRFIRVMFLETKIDFHKHISAADDCIRFMRNKQKIHFISPHVVSVRTNLSTGICIAIQKIATKIMWMTFFSSGFCINLKNKNC